MTIATIAILSPGDMGHNVGRVLGEHGFAVITSLAGRGARSRALAKRGNMRDAGSLDAVVREADLILSIMPPAAALGVAGEVAAAMASTGRAPPYADCNAVSPDTVRGIGEVIAGAGAPFIDAGIIGPPPGRGAPPRFYCSGADAGVLAALDGKGIEVRPMGPEIGRASAIKMCYAALTKGTNTLHVAVLLAAESLGLSAELRDELAASQAPTLSKMEAVIPRLAANSGRWIGEMNEIAATFAAAGVTPHFHQGAAAIHSLLAATPLGAETPETVDATRTLDQTIRIIAAHLPREKPGSA